MINLLSEIILFCLLTITSWLRLIYRTFWLYTLICWLLTITCRLFIVVYFVYYYFLDPNYKFYAA